LAKNYGQLVNDIADSELSICPPKIVSLDPHASVLFALLDPATFDKKKIFKKFPAVNFFLQFLVIKNLDPDTELDPDPEPYPHGFGFAITKNAGSGPALSQCGSQPC